MSLDSSRFLYDTRENFDLTLFKTCSNINFPVKRQQLKIKTIPFVVFGKCIAPETKFEKLFFLTNQTHLL